MEIPQSFTEVMITFIILTGKILQYMFSGQRVRLIEKGKDRKKIERDRERRKREKEDKKKVERGEIKEQRAWMNKRKKSE